MLKLTTGSISFFFTLTTAGGLFESLQGVSIKTFYPFFIQNQFETDCLILICLSRIRAVLSCADPEGGQVVRIPPSWKITSCLRLPSKISYWSNCFSRYVRTALCEIRWLIKKSIQDTSPPPPPPPDGISVSPEDYYGNFIGLSDRNHPYRFAIVT